MVCVDAMGDVICFSVGGGDGGDGDKEDLVSERVNEGELEVEPQPWEAAGGVTGTSVPTACSLLKLGKFIGRGAEILPAIRR